MQNLMEPAGRPEQGEENGRVHARSSFGTIVIRHATAVQHIQLRYHNGMSGGSQLTAAV